MPKPVSGSGKKNLVADNFKRLRKLYGMSQRDVAERLQLIGLDMDKNAVTRIENNLRYVTDIELCAFSKLFNIPLEELISMEKIGK